MPSHGRKMHGQNVLNSAPEVASPDSGNIINMTEVSVKLAGTNCPSFSSGWVIKEQKAIKSGEGLTPHCPQLLRCEHSIQSPRGFWEAAIWLAYPCRAYRSALLAASLKWAGAMRIWGTQRLYWVIVLARDLVLGCQPGMPWPRNVVALKLTLGL